MLTFEHQLTEPLPEVVMPACPVQKLLKGQKALVTGANSGIGKGIAI
jgi:glucose 1-dehydrogenase